MNRRVLAWTGAIALLLVLIGLIVADRPLALGIRTSGFADAAFFSVGLGALDKVTGIHVSYWLAGAVFGGIGAIWLAVDRNRRWPKILIAAALVNFATIGAMMFSKNLFGRLRPSQAFESGDWTHLWFVGGGSFPSGHAAFYFGLFLPLAAACRPIWLRALLLAVPVYVSLARLDLARHFLSDVACSAVIAALAGLIVACLARRWLLAPEGSGA